MLRISMAFIWLLPLLAFAGADEKQASGHACAPDGIGVGGYDLLSYHHADGPLMGDVTFTVSHAGLDWQFVSAANQALFRADPESYMPVYRGWCATSLALGQLTCPDYTNFKIENGRLLLFELAGFTNGRTLWNTDPLGFRRRADANAIDLLNPN